jgi:pyrroline-5-carboxylate reductase
MTPSSNSLTIGPLLVIGFGNMGQAIIRSAVNCTSLKLSEIAVVETDQTRRDYAAEMGIGSVHATTVEAIHEMAGKHADFALLLAVKPQMLAAALAGTSGLIGDRTVISILAGVTAARVREACGGKASVVRVMPNLPVVVSQGMTAIARGAAHDAAETARALFLAAGPSVMEIEESQMDAFTAVAGSGPAYLFHLAQAMMQAAESLGFTSEQASLCVRQTLVGAAAMLMADGREPEDLRAAVTSKGGTTAAAMAVLDEAGAMQTMERAVRAACARGEQLGREA